MRRLVIALIALTACDSGDAKPSDGTPAKAPEIKSDTGENASDDGAPSPPLVIDDANRFVKEDLDRFMAAYPDVLRKSDVELFATCMRAQCLEHGASKTLGPFKGRGVRYLTPLWLRGCLTGSAEACLLAGRTYQGSALAGDGDQSIHEGIAKGELRTKFRQYIDRACKLEAKQCEQWADYRLGDDAPSAADVKMAIQRLQEICGDKGFGSCAALARHAKRHPAIGDARDWWRQACEHAPESASRHCASYAELLLATGTKADRTLAAKTLEPLCDPDSKVWAEECEGDAALGLEACDSVFLGRKGSACVALAATLPDNDALRLYAAFCVGSLLNPVNAKSRKACDEAARLATSLGRPKAYRENLRKRTCEVGYMECLDASFDISACGKKRDRCKSAG